MAKRLLLLVVLLLASGCDHWIEKLAPETTGFARHCFDLLQHRDYAALESLAAPKLRNAELESHLREIAALIPAEAPISSEATSVNVSTTNGYTVSTVTMAYQFQSIWLELDLAAEGQDGLALTGIDLRPTSAPTITNLVPILVAIPVGLVPLMLIGILVYRRRAQSRSVLPARPTLQEQPRTIAPSPRWLGREAIELVSPHSPEECAARLREVVGGWRPFATEPAIGRVDATSFRIRKRLRAVHNSFQTYLSGSFDADGGRTRLRCRLGAHPFVAVFMTLWFGLVASFAVGWTIVGLKQGATGINFFGGLFIPAVMTVFGVGLVAFGRALARNEGAFLLDLVEQTLDARPADRQEPAAVERRTRD